MPEEKNDPKDEKKEDPEHDKCQKPPEPEAGPEKEMSEEEMNESVAFLNEAFAKLKQAMAEAKANGFYVCDRPLVECPHCGLMEDAIENDRLVTFFKNERKKYLNLRFEELETGYFLCPNCAKYFMSPMTRTIPWACTKTKMTTTGHSGPGKKQDAKKPVADPDF
ncbi:MAG: hypothetical protein WA081_04035 [Desulfosalsimonadaceae bacterium]